MNALHTEIANHLAASPKNEIMLSDGPGVVFLKGEKVYSITSEENAVRINGIRYFESQVHYWEA